MGRTAFLVLFAATLPACALLGQQWRPAANATSSLWLASPRSWQSIDFDLSGRPDLLESSLSGIRLVRDPDLTSASYTDSIISSAPQGLMHVGDVNGDFLPDLLTIGPLLQPQRSIRLVPGIGGGLLGAPIPVSNPVGSILALRVFDFDGDGDLDVIACDQDAVNNTDLLVWEQSATGFTLAHSEPFGIPGSSMAIGDFDGNGCDDAICYVGYPVYQHRILWGSPSSPLLTTGISMPWQLQSLASGGDLDGDGRDDIVAAGTQGRLEVYFGAASSLVAGPLLDAGQGPTVFVEAVVDIDRDGQNDVVVSNAQGLLVYRGDGLGGFSLSPQTVAPPSTGAFVLIDLDDDSDLDVLVGGGPALERYDNRTFYGQPCLGTLGEPRLDHGVATPGNAGFFLGVSNAPPGALVEIVIALDGTPGPCGAQFDPAAVLLPVYGAPLFAIATGANGSVQVPLPLPPWLPIGPFYLQALVVDANGAVQLPGLPLSTTRGRVLEIF